ncbi:hypothetical protein A2291_03015 [candidate division WOR-1 bacterium RIFOXYB2_FULL_42_35]|uniref:DUF4258 domain-containing protein n=1 Tax=candidate division WOR-1 bacterium RIFOXYC2_FULL_41_25 TaxID=1802586 RepID=A0A1F4TRG0_UNCSA|nr:MAG: hypothetical protein A2247_01325 [candidate division WOR-1 bacterium RIFOXYA2_FULL_41_14]OGC25718.1 MAG: hypothetical protein A2291_03015 [candidate division WOR-1 bacterium RIFOXYB2_FULL_42_35]OGC35120.1 MAG: hypothetical protein A2462_06160 [candidate division WOR-1 bacterium RIFOXYC2_FULL_41_25]OGC42203.1 MAG: hypothetical protein A2548_03615 [candidate division WOR-1 bacterium RIFOXYD2_FULL_41_8]
MLVYHPHAEKQLTERGIAKAEVERVINKPHQVLTTGIPGRQVAQKILSKGGKRFLYRVVYAIENTTKIVITAYRTSKIKKYLREVYNEG